MGVLFKRNKKDSEELRKKINTRKIPAHIAIIMDGNGRWARKRNLPRSFGHKAGVEAVRDIVKACSELGVKVLTLYTFSTENWKRPADEVSTLMKLLSEYLRSELNELDKNNVKIRSIGDLSKLPVVCQNDLQNAFNTTKNNDGLILNLALNYGGRSEIVDAVKKISRLVKDGRIKPEDINANMVSSFLSTSGLPDPDLIIRPSGELRISNFLLWQSAYSELWFSDIYWPDFKRYNLYEAIIDYQKRDRRFGGLTN